MLVIKQYIDSIMHGAKTKVILECIDMLHREMLTSFSADRSDFLDFQVLKKDGV